jgi:hypothetical protein
MNLLQEVDKTIGDCGDASHASGRGLLAEQALDQPSSECVEMNDPRNVDDDVARQVAAPG